MGNKKQKLDSAIKSQNDKLGSRNDVFGKADDLLVRIAEAEGLINSDAGDMACEIELIKEKYGSKINYWKRIMKDLEKDLVALMKKNSAEIFDGEDRVELKHGSLLFQIEERVKKARGVLEKLEEHGFTEALEISKKVNWDELEKWPVERLALVGTERKRKEVFTHELGA
ncbi:MAG: host-nuclease inhibitor Gam family protein [Deltaproteobacteria bacterium]|nr:host-nuclease inhibitor Gam family protein [Deltaproteobacteria bacterium]